MFFFFNWEVLNPKPKGVQISENFEKPTNPIYIGFQIFHKIKIYPILMFGKILQEQIFKIHYCTHYRQNFQNYIYIYIYRHTHTHISYIHTYY